MNLNHVENTILTLIKFNALKEDIHELETLGDFISDLIINYLDDEGINGILNLNKIYYSYCKYCKKCFNYDSLERDCICSNCYKMNKFPAMRSPCFWSHII